MIEILDKINNAHKTIYHRIDVVIHPLNQEKTLLKECYIKGYRISGIVFKKDGSTLILYEDLKKLKGKKK
ncbi:hypothetical protein LCGC14_1344670 [marine sediment metagenome]|uniref:Uncharacterized protein n=1 Tax=marine sediment metagenome TaxID=412755 RepID=A0A0F9KYX9_9ZZZZ